MSLYCQYTLEGGNARISTDTVKLFDLPQPVAFYRFLTGGDDLHFGFWPQKQTDLSLLEAQKAHSQLILARIPEPPVRILDVGCGLGATSGLLTDAGHQVVAIAPSDSLIDYAQTHHPGPEYICCGFLDDHPRISPPEQYNVILFQESLQYLPELHPVFAKSKALLCPDGGHLIMCDEVSYDPGTRSHSPIHLAREIEKAFHENGFFVRWHERIGPQVTPTCQAIIRLFHEKRAGLLDAFGQDSERLITHFIKEMERLSGLYSTGKVGYEVWDIRPGKFQVRSYQRGDETEILKAFQAAFGTHRSPEHWQWKFLHNPFGGPYISSAWDGDKIVAHYAAYPVPVYLRTHNTIVYQVGDTLTLPLYRGIGRGKNSLLGRVVRHFHRLYCENKIPFFYGFLTGTHQKFGQLFLRYSPITPVHEFVLDGNGLKLLKKASFWPCRLRGYSVMITESVDGWADDIFDCAKHDYGWLVARNRKYLKWRYEQNPDHGYMFYVVRKWGKPTGWWATRIEGQTLLIVDALFPRKDPVAPRAGLLSGLQGLEHEGVRVEKIIGWFSQTPQWWNEILAGLGLRPQRQEQNLDFCVTTFEKGLDSKEIGDKFYFTSGDSDLF